AAGSVVLPARAAGALRCTAALLLVALLAGPADAQGGRGKGGHRGGEPAARAQSTDEYSLDGVQVIEIVERGEGPAALVVYERVAALAEQQGDALRAARAWNAVAIVTVRQGRFQKAIQAADRAIQQFKAAGPRAQSYLGAWASAHAQLASAYRGVGDLSR